MVNRQQMNRADRRCIVTGENMPKDALLRFVVGPEGSVQLDAAEKLPGRGLWLRADRDIIDLACAKGAFSRAAKAKVGVPEDLAGSVEKLLRRRCLDLIGMARRAGEFVGGYEKVKAFLDSGRAGLLLEASDAGRQKLRARSIETAVAFCFNSAELGEAAGRDKLVHAAIAKGKLADRIFCEAARLSCVMLSPPEDHDGESQTTRHVN